MKKLLLIFCLMASIASAEEYVYDVSSYEPYEESGAVGEVVGESDSPYVSGYVIKDGEFIPVEGNFNGKGTVEVSGVGKDGHYETFEMIIEE